ncbi:BQ2448_2067 [Microbotryum intermedium]|uniref:N(6)-L-threonylcarbamoyladenine synthase n=1 Tax=Microbotryum intermedium TaxID=269621 RepID=A0A238F7B8_9BASI|nr:BQ2448_2067 [Microbotryum intermedium]
MVPFELHRLVMNHLLQLSSLHSIRPSRSFPPHRALHSTSQRRTPSSAPLERPLLILGLESSADDTCAAVITSDCSSTQPRLLSNIVIRQPSHEQFGGIHPLHAQHAHARNMPTAIQRALNGAHVGLADLSGIAFTRGPGMMGCLSVACHSAKALSAATGKPLMGVHHMQAHALTPFLTSAIPPKFPFLTLLLSGGHTLLLFASLESEFKILATTHDESIGASFDKAARDLKIPWSLGSGSPGAALEAFAFPSAPTTPTTTTFTMMDRDRIIGHAINLGDGVVPHFSQPFPRQLAFSFSGARSQLDRIISDEPVAKMERERKRLLARSFMQAAVKQVEDKIALALSLQEPKGMRDVRHLVVSGGVASNSYLRKRLREKLDALDRKDVELVFPPPSLCTDNAAMIANVGLSRLRRGRLDPLEVMPIAKWSIEESESDFENEH